MREKSCDLLVKFPTLYIVVKEAVLDGQEQVWYGSIVPLVTCVIGLLIRRDATCQVQLAGQDALRIISHLTGATR